MGLNLRKGGGGDLNGAVITILGYNIDAKEWKEKGKDPYTTFSVELDLQVDGAAAATKRFFKGGFLSDTQTISDDGQTLESEDAEEAIVASDSEWGRFLVSAIDGGFEETAFDESNTRNFAAIVGQRFKLKRELNQELIDSLAKAGKKTKRIGKKDKKEYNYDLLLVAEYLGKGEVKAAGKKAAAAKTGTKAAGKANGTAPVANADALIEQAEDVLRSILTTSEGNTVQRGGLSSAIMRYSTETRFSEDAKQHGAIREQLRKLIASEDFLARGNGWAYDAKAAGQPISLA